MLLINILPGKGSFYDNGQIKRSLATCIVILYQLFVTFFSEQSSEFNIQICDVIIVAASQQLVAPYTL